MWCQGHVDAGANNLLLKGEVVVKGNYKKDSNKASNLMIDISGSTDNNKFIKFQNLSCGSSIGVSTSRPTGTDGGGNIWVPFAMQSGGSISCYDAYTMNCFFSDDDPYSFFAFKEDYSPYNNKTLYLIETWLGYASNSASDLETEVIAAGDTVFTVKSAEGLAYIAKQVKEGNTYLGQTIKLASNINLSTHYWEPIGIWLEATVEGCFGEYGFEAPFLGTFDGQGHVIANAQCGALPFYSMGVFGLINPETTVKNLIVRSSSFGFDNFSSFKPYSIGGLIGRMYGGTVYNCGVIGGTVKKGSYVGGMIGSTGQNKGNKSKIHSCYVIDPVVSGETSNGAMIGMMDYTTLKNCFVKTSNPNSLVGARGSHAGLVQNCYVNGVGTFGAGSYDYCYASSGSASGTNGIYGTPNVTRTYAPSTYNDCQVTALAENSYVPTSGDKSLLRVLNNWVDAQPADSCYSHWVRPNTTLINGGYPVLKMNDMEAMAGHDTQLFYGTASDMITGYTESTDAVYIYNNVANVPSNTSAPLFIDEDAAITQSGAITATVGVTLKNSQSSSTSWDWHMFSSVLPSAPLGINQKTATQFGYGESPVAGTDYEFVNTGYFPTIATAKYGEIDFYSYYEPQYHWINLKRNGNSHWHEDVDQTTGNHEQIHYKATPSATADVNETTLIPGKGYLMALKEETLLQATGTLNNADVSIGVTRQGVLSTGYNLIGNPYQSYYDFYTFANDNATLWSGGSEAASYILVSGNGYRQYVYGESANPFSPGRYLHPHQGFMIIVNGSGIVDGLGTAYFYNAKRKATLPSGATSVFRDEQPNYPLVNLIATGEDSTYDLTTVELGRPDKGGALKAYNLHKGKGCIYTHYEGEDYSIAFTQPGLSEVGIRFETDEEANFTMTWDTENGTFNYLHLIDNRTGADIDCLTASEYHFSATPDDYKSRFKLVFGYTGIEENEEENPSAGSEPFAYYANGEIHLAETQNFASLQIVDMLGRILVSRDGVRTVSTQGVAPGMYILRLTTDNGTRTQKIVIEQ